MPIGTMPAELEAILVAARMGNSTQVIFAVWSYQPDGCFCVSLRPVEGGKSAAFHDVWFEKRGGQFSLLTDVPEFARDKRGDLKLCSDDYDSYWAPAAYTTCRRLKQNVLPSSWLFADLDWVPPHEVPFMPTFAWNTSPGKWQCVWWMQTPLEPREFEMANKTICKQSGADPGTWNSNRLLRIPGSPNHKKRRAHEG